MLTDELTSSSKAVRRLNRERLRKLTCRWRAFFVIQTTCFLVVWALTSFLKMFELHEPDTSYDNDLQTPIVYAYYISSLISVLADLALIYTSWKVSLRLV